MTPRNRREWSAHAQALRAAGYAVLTLPDGGWAVEASRTFVCPSCGLELGIYLSETGMILAMHRAPECQYFTVMDTIETILGPANYARLGEAFTVAGPEGEA